MMLKYSFILYVLIISFFISSHWTIILFDKEYRVLCINKKIFLFIKGNCFKYKLGVFGSLINILGLFIKTNLKIKINKFVCCSVEYNISGLYLLT